MKNNKEKIQPVLFGLSMLFIFLARDGTFTIQIISPLIMLSYICFFSGKKENIIIQPESKYLLIVNFFYIVALIINIFINQIGYYSIIQLAYHFTILLWFIINTQKSFSKGELSCFFKMLRLTCFLCSIYILYNNIVLKTTVFSIKTLFGNSINKNHFAVWISFGLLINLYYILYKKNKIVELLLLIVGAVSLVFLNSRGAIISSFICMGSLLIIFSLKSFNKKKMIYLVLILLLTIIGYKSLLNITPKWLYNRYFVNNYVDDSNMDRIYRWKNAIDGLKDQPFGFGPGVFSSINKYEETEFGTKIPDNTPSHNTFLDIAIDGGILAIITFVVFFVFVGLNLIKKDIIYLPLLFHLIINSMILGAGKTVYFWNAVILFYLLYTNKEEGNIFEGGDFVENKCYNPDV